MASQRLEVRIDPERQSKLRKVAEAKGTTVSAVIRDLIDRAFEDSERHEQMRQAEPIDRESEEYARAERHRLVKLITEAEVEEVPDPETLKRQILTKYDFCDLP